MEDKDTKLGSVNVNLDNTASHEQGNSTQAKESRNQEAITAIKEEDKNGRRSEAKNSMRKGHDNADMGNLYRRVGNFKKAIYYHKEALEIAKQVNDTAGKIDAYGNLGSDYYYLGDFQEAKEYYNTEMVKAKDADDKERLGKAYSNLGKVLYSLNKTKDGMENHKKHLEIAESQEDEKGQGCAYGNIGIGYCRLGKFDKAKEFHNKQLSIAKKVGNKDEQANAYLNLGIVFRKLHHFKLAWWFYLNKGQKIARELPDKALQGNASYLKGRNFECLGYLDFAVQEYRSSVKLYDEVRDSPNMEDSWKITFRDSKQVAYTALWRTLLKRQKTDEALYAAEQGKAQALVDLLHSKGGVEEPIHSEDKIRSYISKELETQTVFFAIESSTIHFWILVKGRKVRYRRKKVEVGAIIQHSNQYVFADVQGTNSLCALYKLIIEPIRKLLVDGELILVPDHQLFLVPYNALQHTDDDSKKTKYLFQSFTIRTAPSLTSLQLIERARGNPGIMSGALLVGDPAIIPDDQTSDQLSDAKTEIDRIARILRDRDQKVKTLIHDEANKENVLREFPSVELIHIAAHAKVQSGEIDLAGKDGVLTMSDVQGVRLQAKLVVLSCCNTGRGKVTADGVVGIARAFLAAGARSVLVSLCEIGDQSTMQFMEKFYEELADGKVRRSASLALQRTMDYFRNSPHFSDVKYWAPFVLIGDEVTLEFGEREFQESEH